MMAYLSSFDSPVKGGSEIDILKQHRSHTWERVIAALSYARSRLPLYTAAEKSTLSEILVEIKNYYVACYTAGFIEDNPGPVASRLYFYLRSFEED